MSAAEADGRSPFRGLPSPRILPKHHALSCASGKTQMVYSEVKER
ncbi:hypothetical protein HMPREF7215_1275 [Pyramidobacter piscolens W5455]|uniref:Uncharacterized protein n=1 Tax=Pyramidobacter piscolens W5455 TaxID=352165 RepID=A0ABM9ZW71_9BACT|nr:hypothetical protein HMPREF7215_1275 [Pyramidobacter piscolens W5455]